jgi:RNA polymerase primary sigma factor
LSIEDRYDEVRELIIIGKERGYLLYDEINNSLPEGIYSSDELDSIFSLFGSAGIEVIDPEQEFQIEGIKDDDRDESNGKGGNFLFGPLPLDKTIDPARLYFREMSTLPLLSREGEVGIATNGTWTEGGFKALSCSLLVVRDSQH